MVAALTLARGGARSRCSRRRALGSGRSSRNGGIFHPGLKWGRAALERSHGPELGRAIFRPAWTPSSEPSASSTRKASTATIGVRVWQSWPGRRRTSDGLEPELEEFQGAGLTGRVIRRDEVGSELGSELYGAAAVIEESGMIHPGRYFAGIAQAADAAGVDLHTGISARRVEREGADGWS